MKRLILWIPLTLFMLFVLVVVFGLASPSSRTVTSKMVGKPLPAFTLPPGVPSKAGLDTDTYRQGEPRVLNVFASWCVPCIAEAPQLVEIARRGLPIDAMAIRDRPVDIAEFLATHGDPYQRIGSDEDSRVQLSLGSSGVPETFIIDGAGVIRFQHIGAIRPEHVPGLIKAYEAAR